MYLILLSMYVNCMWLFVLVALSLLPVIRGQKGVMSETKTVDEVVWFGKGMDGGSVEVVREVRGGCREFYI